MQENGVCGVIIITRGAGGCRRGGAFAGLRLTFNIITIMRLIYAWADAVFLFINNRLARAYVFCMLWMSQT